jgi:hypothetical protein
MTPIRPRLPSRNPAGAASQRDIRPDQLGPGRRQCVGSKLVSRRRLRRAVVVAPPAGALLTHLLAAKPGCTTRIFGRAAGCGEDAEQMTAILCANGDTSLGRYGGSIFEQW